MEIVQKFSAEAFRYYFLRECPFPSDGEFGWGRFAEVYNAAWSGNATPVSGTVSPDWPDMPRSLPDNPR